MKNKGRPHKAGNGNLKHNGVKIPFAGVGNCKGALVLITRDITKMGRSPFSKTGESKRFTKKKWSKRVRGYFKSQTKDLYGQEDNA